VEQKSKILIVCSCNAGYVAPFIIEQVDSLKKLGVEIDFFIIKGKGLFGYLKNFPSMLRKIKSYRPDLIHAHCGFPGMLAVLQRKIPVIITFHGGDVNEKGRNRTISKLAERLAVFSIFVNPKLAAILKPRNSYDVISCGVDLSKNFFLDKREARIKLGLDLHKRLILFSSRFTRDVKNYPLAKSAVEPIGDVELIEMKGYSRYEVTLLMNACDVLLVTSKHESGPLVVKEAMACGCPIVSTDVGDVRAIIGKTEGCFITSFEPTDVSQKLSLALALDKRINGRERIIELGLSLERVAEKINLVYRQVLKVK
jgi:glycosyltransferase involved in cell wall biosynthesis